MYLLSYFYLRFVIKWIPVTVFTEVHQTIAVLVKIFHPSSSFFNVLPQLRVTLWHSFFFSEFFPPIPKWFVNILLQADSTTAILVQMVETLCDDNDVDYDDNDKNYDENVNDEDVDVPKLDNSNVPNQCCITERSLCWRYMMFFLASQSGAL